MQKHMVQHRSGFTLIDMMLSVTILSLVFVMISSSIDITEIFAKLFSTGDETAVRSIGQSLSDYRWDHDGDVPANANLTSDLQPICKQTLSEVDCAAQGGVYLNDLIIDQTYLVNIPVAKEYLSDAELMTGYKIAFPHGNGGRVYVTNADESQEFEY